MDRLQSLLNGRNDPAGKDKNVNHAIERSMLNNADRKFNKIVYDNELKSANLYNQSTMPNTGKDIGVGFKINVYTIRLTQLLSIKADLEKALSTFFATGVSVQKLRGATREAQVATDFFKKADILSTYNELMLYIKTYATDIINDDSFKAQVFNTSFNPLIQLFTDTSALYPIFFNQLPVPSFARTIPPAERAEERKIYETAREQSIGCYSLFNTMASFMNNLIFRPIVKDDVTKYISDNNVKAIFEKNPYVAPVQPQGQPQAPPAQALPVLQGDDQTITAIVNAYEAQVGRYLFAKTTPANPNSDPQDAFDFSAPNFQPLSAAEERAVLSLIRKKIRAIRQALNIGNLAEATAPALLIASQRYAADQQAGQQAQPAPAPIQPAPVQPQDPNRVAYEQAGGTDIQQYVIPDLTPQQTQEVLTIYKALENQSGAILRPDIADGRKLYQALPQPIQDALMRVGTGNELPDSDTAVNDNLIPFITQIKQLRQAWGNARVDAQGQPAVVPSESLYGLGRERNNDLVMNSILDFETMARRPAKESDVGTIMELSPQTVKLEPKIRFIINKLRQERRSEPNMYGKGKYENQQGIKQRASMLQLMDEFEPKAEALKRGKIMSGGCDTCEVRGGMGNQEWGYSGYGEVEDEQNTPFKRMLIGMPNPFAPKVPISTLPHQFLPYNSSFDDYADQNYYNEILPEEGSHYAELEKPVDLDETADAIRKNNENYKVMTGRMKNIKYKN
jgi:hypothetical protein|nr:MAG: hypothetical protein [Lake Baikal virophage 1]